MSEVSAEEHPGVDDPIRPVVAISIEHARAFADPGQRYAPSYQFGGREQQVLKPL
jgi:hypothetical protein